MKNHECEHMKKMDKEDKIMQKEQPFESKFNRIKCVICNCYHDYPKIPKVGRYAADA